MLIKNTKDLQENLIDMMDWARVHHAEIVGGRDLIDDDFTDEELYELGKMDGYGEACGAIYLAVFGGREYGKLLDMLMQKGAADD